MKRYERVCRIAAAFVAALLLASISASADDRDIRGVISPGSMVPVGLTYGELSARWWQWAYSLPVNKNPWFDYTDCSNGAQGQSGPVWFLTGVISRPDSPLPNGTAIRPCSVPSGKMLFFPILNQEVDDIPCPGVTPTGARFDREQARVAMNGAVDMKAEIDGISIAGLDSANNKPYTGSYRVISPLPFFVRLPDHNNVPQAFNCPVAGEQGLMVADGVFLLLEPLAEGRHTVHFSGSVPAANFKLDITYHLDVR